MPNPPVAVTIRGITYHSQVEAGKALGISNNAISKAYRLGTLDLVGMRSMKATAIIELLAKATPEDFPKVQAIAKRWVEYQDAKERHKRDQMKKLAAPFQLSKYIQP